MPISPLSPSAGPPPHHHTTLSIRAECCTLAGAARKLQHDWRIELERPGRAALLYGCRTTLRVGSHEGRPSGTEDDLTTTETARRWCFPFISSATFRISMQAMDGTRMSLSHHSAHARFLTASSPRRIRGKARGGWYPVLTDIFGGGRPPAGTKAPAPALAPSPVVIGLPGEASSDRFSRGGRWPPFWLGPEADEGCGGVGCAHVGVGMSVNASFADGSASRLGEVGGAVRRSRGSSRSPSPWRRRRGGRGVRP